MVVLTLKQEHRETTYGHTVTTEVKFPDAVETLLNEAVLLLQELRKAIETRERRGA